MKFEAVLPKLRKGKEIKRQSWGEDESLRKWTDKMAGLFPTFELTMEDLLAEDWEVVA